IKFPRTNINRSDMISARRSALKVGALHDTNTQYLWNLAFLLEGIYGETEYVINWRNVSDRCVHMSMDLARTLRHGKLVPGAGGFIKLIDTLKFLKKRDTPAS
ncbi:MAG: hypothetical protein ACKPKO_25215, partial [Candidatus Fonsibacter sp.]